jgi:Flp pilus assembly protein TadD
MAVEPRAGNNLQACLVGLGQLEEAAAMGPELADRDPGSPTSPANTARALVALQRLDEAEGWALEAANRAPERCALHMLLGNIRGQLGRLDQADESFTTALELGPECAVEARHGLDTVARLRPTPEAPEPD